MRRIKPTAPLPKRMQESRLPPCTNSALSGTTLYFLNYGIAGLPRSCRTSVSTVDTPYAIPPGAPAKCKALSKAFENC